MRAIGMNRVAALLAVFLMAVGIGSADAARIKDISTIGGVRENQLIGYGLMVGLKNSGDNSHKSPFTIQTLLSMLKRLGTTVDVRQLSGSSAYGSQLGMSETRNLRDVRVENVAAVMVTATLPAFARPGQKIDVHVSSLGDARSLEGGTLLLTPLKGANGQVYAVAQGRLPEEQADRGDKRKRHGRNMRHTKGSIASGGIVEREVGIDFASKTEFNLLLKEPDFKTASTVAAKINEAFGEKTAKGLDASTVQLKLPEKFKGEPFRFIAEMESLDVERDVVAKVVLDERTGTVIIGENVQVGNVAISVGDMTLEIRHTSGFMDAPVAEDKENLSVIQKNGNINDLVKALNALGVSPKDLAAIFRSLRAAGALNAELEIIS